MQGISALKHLLTFGYGPSDVRLLCKPENLNHKLTSFCRVVFGGESAGGRWTLSILAHLHRHRHSEAAGECVINPYEPLKGCFDESIIRFADMFPATINNWKENGYGEGPMDVSKEFSGLSLRRCMKVYPVKHWQK